MFLPGLPSPAPEVIAALMSGQKPTPFDALEDGLDLWERRFGLFPEVAQYVGSERLGTPPVVTGQMPGGRAAGGASEMEMLPSWQRILSAGETLPKQWMDAKRVMWKVQEEWQGKKRVKGEKGEKEVLFDAAVAQSSRLADLMRQAFSLVERRDMDVLRRQLQFLGSALSRWAWVVGRLSQYGRPLVPSVVWEGMAVDWEGDPTELLEGLTVIRLMQGERSMATYVLSRWLSDLVWGPLGLSGQLPALGSPLMQELKWAWERRDRMVEAAPFLSSVQKEEMEALRWDSAQPNGIGWGMSLLWERVFRYASGQTEVAELFRDVLEKNWTEDDDPYGEVKSGEGVTMTTVMHAWLSRQTETRDDGGRLERVLLPVVTHEMATTAALVVLRWRNQLLSTRLWQEPRGLVASVESWMAQMLVRMDGGCAETCWSGTEVLENHCMRPSGGLLTQELVSVLSAKQRWDWRVEELLRPLLFSALSSMAIGLKAGYATQLQQLDWVREKVWNPEGPAIKVDQVFAQLLMLCSHEKCTVPRLRALDQRLARQLGVKPAEVEEWMSCQPFSLVDLEEFRQRVKRKEVEPLSVGGLVETLTARNHFVPSWVTNPLSGLAIPRQYGDF